MDPSQSTSRVTSALMPTSASQGEQPIINAAGLSLVSDHLLLAQTGDAEVPAEWKSAIETLTDALQIDARWVADGKRPGLLQKARRAVSLASASCVPAFAPWRVVSPTSFQFIHSTAPFSGAQWVASYLFDFGPTCSFGPEPFDIALMSPCPDACVADDPQTGPLPRMAALAKMVRAALSEGRTRLAIVTHEAARASLASRLLAFDPKLKETSIEVEFLSIEEAVIEIQRGECDWDAVIATPDLRGVLFAMLAEATEIRGPWPMLWFDGDGDGGLRYVCSESLKGGSAFQPLDATALIQSLALTASHGGGRYAADRLYKSWAAVRDRGVVTRSRSSSAPYTNEIDEAAFIDQAIGKSFFDKRPLPSWKSVECEDSAERKTANPVRLKLVT